MTELCEAFCAFEDSEKKNKTASIVLAVLSWVEFQWLSLFWHRVKNFSLSMMARWWSQVPMTPVSS